MPNQLNKQTPMHTLDWYVKWIASLILLFGMLLTANNVYPINLIFHLIGLCGWFFVALVWNDRALIIINAVSISILMNGLLRYVLECKNCFWGITNNVSI